MITLFEMFSGFGGASFALKKLGIDFECVGFSEIDKYAIECYDQNHKGKNYGDCKEINPWSLDCFDLLTAGFPCQSFSVAGKGLGELDTRGTLFNEIIRVAEIKKPRWMLLENVKGLTNKKHKATFEKILSELDRIGYTVHWQVLNSKEHGIPQNRERVFFVCFRESEDSENWSGFPEKEELKIFLKDILEDEVDEKYYLSEKQTIKLELHLKNKKSKVDEKVINCIGTCFGRSGSSSEELESFARTNKAIQVGMINQTCKKRVHDTPKEINGFLKVNKGLWTLTQIAARLELPKTQVEHYFRTDESRAIPSPKIWKELKELLHFKDDYDSQVMEIYEKEIEFESTRRVYSDEGCSPTISSTNADKIIQLNNPSHSNNRIYSDEGCSPSLNTMQGGNRQPFIISSMQKHNSINNKGLMNCLPSAMGMGGGHTPMVEDLKYVCPKCNSNENLSFKKDEVCDGYFCACTNCDEDFYEFEISPTRIRKLTPKECFRLMGFLNDEINLGGLSNTQRYKLAGNGWDINLVSKILNSLNLKSKEVSL